MRKKTTIKFKCAFTLIEIVIVLIMLAIAAVLAAPMLGSASDMQLRSAANMIVAHIEYAKSMAITRQQNYSVVFDSDNESYEVRDQTGTVIENPQRSGSNLAIIFPNDSRVNRVDIASADFDSDSSQTITFDYLGSPYSGPTTASPLNSGQITLQADTLTMIVNVEPVTGYTSIVSP
jgi:prepilin-type N-terminal cleavage/methylation domain-containing protein